MGAPDPRLDTHGDTNFCLDRQLGKYKKDDPPSQRVKPVPLSVVWKILVAAYMFQSLDDGFRAVADMICIGFYFLMRPGEHTLTPTNTPFKLEDLKLYIQDRRMGWDTATDGELD